MRKKKITNIVQTKEKKSRAKYQCPEALRGFIFDVNIIPENTVLRDYEEIRREIIFSPLDGLTKEEVYIFLLEQNKNRFNECFVNFSGSFKEKLLKSCEASELKNHPNYDKWNFQMASLDLAQDNYQYLYRINNNLRAIADFFSHLRSNNYQFTNESQLITSSGETITLPSFEVQLKREGTKGKVHKGLSEAVIDVDLDRIRDCEICNRIFWANYKNSFTCSKTCLNALRQRRHRKTNKEAINEKRRANYSRNKKLKQIKEKNNVIV